MKATVRNPRQCLEFGIRHLASGLNGLELNIGRSRKKGRGVSQDDRPSRGGAERRGWVGLGASPLCAQTVSPTVQQLQLLCLETTSCASTACLTPTTRLL